jgi:hypothetical protein
VRLTAVVDVAVALKFVGADGKLAGVFGVEAAELVREIEQANRAPAS